MSHITKGHCKTCGKFYEGRGKFYCSNACCKKDPEYQTKRVEALMGKPAWNKGTHAQLNNALAKWRKGGGIPWNKGIKGLHLSFQTQFKKGDGRIIGANNSNWKGGITDENTKIRQSAEYKQWAKLVYFRDKWICQHCKKKCQANNIVAHHIYYFSWIPEIRLLPKNGVTLCRSCHFKLHQGNKKVDSIFYQIIMKPKNHQFVIGQNLGA